MGKLKAMQWRVRRAFTLIEMLVVVAILVALAGIVVPMLDNTKANATDSVTRTSMTNLRDAIKTFYLDTGKYPESIGNLMIPVGMAPYLPATKTGWNGPYVIGLGEVYKIDGPKGFVKEYNSDWSLTGANLTNPDPVIFDSFSQEGKAGSPFVLQIPDTMGAYDHATELKHTRLISAGPNGIIDTPRTDLIPSLAAQGDDIVLYLRVQVTP